MNLAAINLLLVEDSDDDAVLLMRELERGGYDVACRRVDDAGTMADALHGGAWDIVIADYCIPGFSGLEALEMVQREGLDLPFLLVSGQLGEEHARAAMRAGAHDYIVKHQLARLVPAVERELRDAGTRRARRQAEALLLYNARHDSLTGLANRREFERMVERLRNEPAGECVTVLASLDLDQFRLVNDTAGHAAGDGLLRHAAAVIRDAVAEHDIVARLGGDEYGILLVQRTLAEASMAARRILDELHRQRFQWDGRDFDVSASVGLVSISAETRSSTELLGLAEVARCAARDIGRNRVHVYESTDIDIARRRRETTMVANLDRALDTDAFVLYFQLVRPRLPGPGRPCQVEVLLRLRDHRGRLVSPAAFMPAAEHYHFMPAIDTWVGEHLLLLMESLLARHESLPFSLCLNVSAASLGSADYRDYLRANMAAACLPPEMLILEVAESAAITQLESATRFMHEFRELGVRFALDDVGAGLSSFNQLRELPVDLLKVGGGFVRRLGDPVSRSILESYLRIGRALGLQTVVESVETDTTLDLVNAMDVDYLQGYAVHRPEPLTEQAIDRLVEQLR